VAPPDTELVEIFKSFGPFVVMQILVLALVLLFPELALRLVR
jgi:TRAP-type mannitol/chloroaromatic compound transport system permease large subunit